MRRDNHNDTMFLRRAIVLRLLLLIGVPVVAAGIGLAIWQQGGRFVSTEDAYVKTDIAQISPEVAGRVIDVAVRDQTPVKAGELLLRLDPVPYQLALDKAEATLDAARIQVENARASYFETRSELGEVESQADYLQRQFQRQKELARTGVVSATKLEEAQNDASVARDRLNVVRARLQRVLTMLGGDPAIPTDQHPMVRDKRAERDRASLDLSHTTLVAPIGGVAVNVKLQPGEQVKAATPLFVIVSDRAAVGGGEPEGDRAHPCPRRPEGARGAGHLSRRDLGRRGGEHQPGDRRGIRDPAAAECLGELGEGGAAPAGARAAAAA